MELGLNLSLFNLLQYLILLFITSFCFFKCFFTTPSSSSSSSPQQLSSKKISPPSPPRLPIIGNFHQVVIGSSVPHRSLHSLSQKYGPLMMLRFGTKSVLVASSSEAAREIMKNQDMVFSDRPKYKIMDKLLHGTLDIAFAPYSEYWRELKSICILQLLSNKRVRSFRDIREEGTTRMIEKIRQSCSATVIINLSKMLVTLTNDVTVKVIIGKRYSCSEDHLDKNIVEMIKRFTEVLGHMNIADYIPWMGWVNDLNGLNAKVERVSKELDEIMDDIIQQNKIRKEEEEEEEGGFKDSSNFVDILHDVQRRKLTSFPLEVSTIKAVLLDMIAAGIDTTYTLMDWVMVELLRHPKIMEKLQTEIRQVVAAEGKTQEVTEDDLPKMPNLKAVIKEVCRLHPPVPLLVRHKSSQDVKVMGYDIPDETQVLINVWAIGRDPKIWEKPEEFRPERFLNSEVDFQGLHFELIPFGAGRRSCPGISFGIAVNELGLAKLLYNFNFSLPYGIIPKEMDMTENNGVSGRRKNPLLVHVVSPCSS